MKEKFTYTKEDLEIAKKVSLVFAWFLFVVVTLFVDYKVSMLIVALSVVAFLLNQIDFFRIVYLHTMLVIESLYTLYIHYFVRKDK